MSIYDSIVNGINQTKTSLLGIAPYLQSLKPTVKLLRRSYLNKPVHVPYHEEGVQSAYLITYLPHYYNLIYSILIAEGEAIFGEKETINIGYIGGGPGSEVYGTIKYILNNRPSIKKVNIVVFDINADTWKYSHKIVQDYLIKDIEGSERIEFTWTAKQFDLTNPSDIQSNQSIFRKLHLLVVQNCLNEIAANQFDQLKANVNSIFASLPGSSFFLMSDLTSGARDLIKRLEKHLEGTGTTRYKKTTLDQAYPISVRSINAAPSKLIGDNLLTNEDGLIPRVNLKYDYSLLSKEQITERETIGEAGFMSLYSPLANNQIDANNYVHTKSFVGIDFGTSNTVISYAYLENEKLKVDCIPIIQKDDQGGESESRLVPSILALSNNRLLVGKHAAELKAFLEKDINCWYGFKENLLKISTTNYPESELINDPDLKIANAEDALQIYFSYIKRGIEKYLIEEKRPTEIEYAISIPAGFNTLEKVELKKCMISGGILAEDAPLIDEPNAALINYLFERNLHLNNSNQSEKIIVIDLGAGTVDVSIIAIDKSHEGINSKLLAVNRLGFIGGNLLDKLILEKVLPADLNLNQLPYLIQNELQSYCEKLKIKLCGNINLDKSNNYQLPSKSSSNEEITINVSQELNSFGINRIALSFKEFSTIIDDYLIDLLKTIEPAIKSSGLKIDDINKVILTGGGGRNPYLKNKFSNYFYNSELIIPDNIQEHVARGTALHSFIYNSYGKNIVTPILSFDVYIEGSNKKIVLFKSGETIPSQDLEVSIENNLIEKVALKAYFGDEIKWFILPSNTYVIKLILYITQNQELECEIVTKNDIIKVESAYKSNDLKLIILK
jgi:molecular chaperone DnaK (HSP70)